MHRYLNTFSIGSILKHQWKSSLQVLHFTDTNHLYLQGRIHDDVVHNLKIHLMNDNNLILNTECIC